MSKHGLRHADRGESIPRPPLVGPMNIRGTGNGNFSFNRPASIQNNSQDSVAARSIEFGSGGSPQRSEPLFRPAIIRIAVQAPQAGAQMNVEGNFGNRSDHNVNINIRNNNGIEISTR